jgi:hypothetical protein
MSCLYVAPYINRYVLSRELVDQLCLNFVCEIWGIWVRYNLCITRNSNIIHNFSARTITAHHRNYFACEIWGFHSGEKLNCGILAYTTVQSFDVFLASEGGDIMFLPNVDNNLQDYKVS